jgi:endo-alpha-1,4-polygalactosaminidase (GH114 family)
VYSNGGGGFSLTQTDAINYLKAMSSYAATLGMSTGLKNAQEILPQVMSDVQFAINEQCVTQTDRNTKCTEYNDFLAAGKPVLHIEYVDDGSSKSIAAKKALARMASIEKRNGNEGVNISKARRDELCNISRNGAKLSTVIKYLSLDGWVLYCDGSAVTTSVQAGEKSTSRA